MKKTLIILALTALSLSLAFADVTYGLRGGLNMTNRSSSKSSDKVDNRTGFHGGLILQYNTDSNFIVQPEILYTQKGYKNIGAFAERTVAMDYVEVPVLLKYNIEAARGLHLQPTVAPYVGYAVIAKDNLLPNDNILDRINKIDYGVDMGLDIQLLNQVLVGARYKIGLADYGYSILNSTKNTHNGLIFSLGFLF